MSTKWGKHIYHTVGHWDSDGGVDSLWHVVVHGQKSLIVEVPKTFPCWKHRAAINSLIDEADVDHYSFLEVIPDENGEWSLNSTVVSSVPALRCSLWAPLIDEREIHVLEWIRGQVKLAVWRGIEVVVKTGTSPNIDENYEIAAQSEAYRFLQGHDLTPKFLGHLYRDGVVIGFVLEALVGRRPLLEDREACYAAVQKLYATGTFHSDLNQDNIIITKAGVRFVDIVLGACDPDNSEDYAIQDVDSVFDGEIGDEDFEDPTPPRYWPDERAIDWDKEWLSDVKRYGECPFMPPVRKNLHPHQDNPWREQPLVPYVPDVYKPWDISEVGWPSTLEGLTRSHSAFPYHRFLSPEYLSLQLSYLPPGQLPYGCVQLLPPHLLDPVQSGPGDHSEYETGNISPSQDV